MTRIGRLVTWPLRLFDDIRYGKPSERCTFCPVPIRPGYLDLHYEIDHAGDQE